MILGYIRVSTREQNTARQRKALREICEDVVVEKISATAEKRPEFTKAIARLNAGDTFVVLDLDRAFRSTIDAILCVEQLKDRGVQFKVLNSPIDTTTEMGELVFTIFAAMAQAERKMIRRLTLEGPEAARARGKLPGRPRKLSDAQIALAKKSIESRIETISGMAGILGVDRKTLSRALQRSAQEIDSSFD